MRYTLVSDGSSDRALIPILTWTLRRHGIDGPVDSRWADLGRLRRRPANLADKLRVSVELYPCDLLFVHRDAETRPVAERAEEIADAAQVLTPGIPVVRVIPVRMMEAWLLIIRPAIRTAAGNPNGTETLNLPALAEVEALVNPKRMLHGLIRQASGLGTIRRRDLKVRRLVHRIAELVDDFSPLEEVPAFSVFSTEVGQVLALSGLLPTA